MHPERLNPYIFPNSNLPLNKNESPNKKMTNNGPAISWYKAIFISLRPLYVSIAMNLFIIFDVSISSSSRIDGSSA